MDVSRPKKAHWIFTRGPAGTLLMNAEGEVTIPAIPTVEVDATGAGDSFVAGTTLGLVNGHTLEEALNLGSHFGAFAVKTLGIPDFTKFEKAF